MISHDMKSGSVLLFFFFFFLLLLYITAPIPSRYSLYSIFIRYLFFAFVVPSVVHIYILY